MTAFIFFISFLLHIIAFAAIAQLLRQIKQLKQQHKSEEVIELFETYLQEVREENRVLEEKLTTNSVQRNRKTVDEPEQRTLVDDYNQTGLSEESIIPPETEGDDTSETSLQARILHLHAQGISHEEIAKMLNCGKTEAELIIKLHTKKE